MGLISPTPRQGSWVEGDAFTGPWQDQPRQGSWVRSDPVTDWPATRRPRTSVGVLVARARSAGHVDS